MQALNCLEEQFQEESCQYKQRLTTLQQKIDRAASGTASNGALLNQLTSQVHQNAANLQTLRKTHDQAKKQFGQFNREVREFEDLQQTNQLQLEQATEAAEQNQERLEEFRKEVEETAEAVEENERSLKQTSINEQVSDQLSDQLEETIESCKRSWWSKMWSSLTNFWHWLEKRLHGA